MPKDVTFQLDTKGGEEVLTALAAPVIKRSADAIAARATAMASSMSSNPPTISVSTAIGTIKKGIRAYATITAEGNGDAHSDYIANTVLAKSKDAGRV